MKIGMIGLGIMGRPMALKLLAAGHQLTVWARRPEMLAPLLAAGAVAADSPAELGSGVELVITMVADAPDVESVLLGDTGVAGGATEGLLAIDMSTIAPASARHIGAQLAERGIDFVDAPVSGGEAGAIAGSLSIMAGGSEAAFARALPVLQCLGTSVVHVGSSGAGQVAKAANQIVTGMGVVAVAEAFNFARRAGVDGARVREALLGGFASSKILENHGRRMLERDFRPGFKAWMQQKDLGIVSDCAQHLGIALPGAAVAGQLFNAMVGSGLGDEDSIAVLKLFERLSGDAEQ
jgi:2-hydroxy-3-oxopropionate reductase